MEATFEQQKIFNPIDIAFKNNFQIPGKYGKIYGGVPINKQG